MFKFLNVDFQRSLEGASSHSIRRELYHRQDKTDLMPAVGGPLTEGENHKVRYADGTFQGVTLSSETPAGWCGSDSEGVA